MNLTHETSFPVMAADLNDQGNLIFGGKVMEEADKAAYVSIKEMLWHTECDSAVTVDVKLSFINPAYKGDIYLIKSTVWETGKTSIKVKIEGFVKKKDGLTKQAYGYLTFCTMNGRVPTPHKLPTIEKGKIVEE